MNNLRIYTCTPIPFSGDHTFFSRDSGLCCRGLQSIGIESRAIMPYPAIDSDEADLIRTDYENLESVAWWRNLEIDGLIFYCWGDPRYTKIANAIRQAGIRLLINMDTGGLLTPVVERGNFYQALAASQVRRFGVALGNVFALLKFLRLSIPQIKDLPRIQCLKNADVIAAISPIAQGRIQAYLRYYGEGSLADRVAMIPHPVNFHFQYGGQTKLNQVICVGRWDDPQKDASLAVRSILLALQENPNYEAVFIGSGSERIHTELAKHSVKHQRIKVIGIVKNKELVSYYLSSKISFCSSVFESGHIVSEEALCSGCSIVAPDSPSLPSMPYYVSKSSGQLGERNVQGLAAALGKEIDAWDSGKRDPFRISADWREEVQVEKIALKMVTALGLEGEK